jgi:hypothetical protein
MRGDIVDTNDDRQEVIPAAIAAAMAVTSMGA